MIHKRKISKVLMLVGSMCIALTLFFCPVSNLPVKAATGETVVQPKSDDIRYRFAIFDNKIYKRLYNYSTGEWIGDWIYVRDV